MAGEEDTFESAFGSWLPRGLAAMTHQGSLLAPLRYHSGCGSQQRYRRGDTSKKYSSSRIARREVAGPKNLKSTVWPHSGVGTKPRLLFRLILIGPAYKRRSSALLRKVLHLAPINLLGNLQPSRDLRFLRGEYPGAIQFGYFSACAGLSAKIQNVSR